jgi:hypothetical protein
MHPLQEQFKSNTLVQLNTQVLQAGRIAGNLLEISHEIGVLNVRTGKASAEALAGAVQKLLAASNPVEFLQLAANVMRPDPQVWSVYADQLRGIAGKMVAPVTENLANTAAEAAPAPLDLQGVVPPAAMEVVAQEPPLPVEAVISAQAEIPAKAEAPVEAKAQVQPDTATPAAAAAEAAPEVQKMAEAIDHVAKSTPVISAATQDPKAMAKATVVPKAAVKAGRAQAMQKGAATGKSAGRSRKG